MFCNWQAARGVGVWLVKLMVTEAWGASVPRLQLSTLAVMLHVPWVGAGLPHVRPPAVGSGSVTVTFAAEGPPEAAVFVTTIEKLTWPPARNVPFLGLLTMVSVGNGGGISTRMPVESKTNNS